MHSESVERWGIFDAAFHGPAGSNPFTDVTFSATFTIGHRTVDVDGFYDGDGTYRVRFMPDEEGQWAFTTSSNVPELDGQNGSFTCVSPTGGNHGPVRVHNRCHFAYADGTPHMSVGTTCYVWNHQGDALEEQTLATLRDAPFNKIRMCVFPKHYTFSVNEPELYPFEGEPLTDWDFSRFNPEFFRHLELRIGQLMELGIESDLILFHPYDHWGFSTMTRAQDEFYLRYVVARLAAYRNIWWSFANEFDLMREKRMADWDAYFKLVQTRDHAQHLRSIHNCRAFYDHAKPWVTHCSIQSADLGRVAEWRAAYGKPVVDDECCYEGNVEFNWGNITAQELVHRFWTGVCQGGYVGHGETYLHPEDILWWSKGGVLHGESAPRIAFLRRIMEEGPHGLDPLGVNWNNRALAGREPDYYLQYLGNTQPARRVLDLPEGHSYAVDVIDAWNMTVERVPGVVSGKCVVPLPGRPYVALRARRIANVE
jgi:hypothetical protein